ncbi:MAG: hypothetical protein AAFP85_10130 [Pseudomonadota bacterium]
MKRIVQSALGAAALSLSLFTPATVLANDHLLSQFSHTVDYITEHGVSVVKSSDGGALVVLETDFNTRNSAELRLLLGKDGLFTREADLGPLAHLTGLQVFRAPPGVDMQQFTELHIWNPQHDVVVGVAPLN